MAETTNTRRKAAADSARLGEKDFVSRLADAGEEALQKLADLPGGQKAIGAMNDLRNRVDELGKKVRGIDALEERVTKLEKEVASLKRSKPASSRSTARKPSS
jgi:hypothetical protein